MTAFQLEGSAAGATLGGMASIQLVADNKGNMGWQWTVGAGPAITSATASAFVQFGGTNANRIQDLEQWGIEYGGGGGAFFGGGGAFIQGLAGQTFQEATSKNSVATYSGGAGGGGLSTPGVEGHAYFTYTRPVGVYWNYFDMPVVKNMFSIIENYLG